MRDYSSDEIQQISSDFRNIARRLLRTDVEQSDANLKRFMVYLETNELIMSFLIGNSNSIIYDIPKILKEREWLQPFEISPIRSEEIAFEYQLLKFAVENRNGDFTSLYNRCYIHTKATFNDSAKDFISHVVDPLVDYISDFLRQKYEGALRSEGKSTLMSMNTVNAKNSTVLVNSPVVTSGTSNQIAIGSSVKIASDEIMREIEEVLPEYRSKDQFSDFVEILNEIKEQISHGEKPKKALIAALKAVGAGFIKIVPLVIKLWELFA